MGKPLVVWMGKPRATGMGLASLPSRTLSRRGSQRLRGRPGLNKNYLSRPDVLHKMDKENCWGSSAFDPGGLVESIATKRFGTYFPGRVLQGLGICPKQLTGVRK